ncbi:histidine N-acetyltransferase-like [Argopecten irradians]|uniref:histidine N-acetyltransferase-like n=1 Tax=Argopecten irradians TaxID=31199 RepID=UPI003724B666
MSSSLPHEPGDGETLIFAPKNGGDSRIGRSFGTKSRIGENETRMIRRLYERAPLYRKFKCFSTTCVYRKYTEHVQFRRATPDDYENVVSIRPNVYNGYDYIPDTYHQLLKYNTGYVGFIEKEMVCFQFAAEIDNGRSVMIQSGRIKEKYEGLGLVSAMIKYGFNDVSQSANRVVSVTRSPSARDKLLKRNAHLLCTMDRLVFSTSREALVSTYRSANVDMSFPVVADASLLNDIFISQETTPNIFPENRLVIRGTVYELMDSNIDQILGLSDQVLVSRDSDTSSATLISFASIWHCYPTSVVFINLYGDMVDEKDICGHILRHTASMASSCREKVVVYVVCTKQYHKQTVRNVMEKHSWEFLTAHNLYAIEETFNRTS